MNATTENKHREIIPKSRMENFWKVRNKNKELYFLPEDLPERENNQFLIYLTGLSLKEQIKATGGLIPYPFDGKDLGLRRNRFWQNTSQEIIDQIINQQSKAGYYLVEICEDVNQDFVPPSGWRLAKINEASEIIQSIYQISELRYLRNALHIAKEDKKIITAIGNFKEKQGLEIWRGHLEIFKKYQKRAAIIVYEG
ncbi:hypothetical protein M0Q39_04530 [Patescibacteria group bacterium]|nr:hypothetical protein [Patescibacteria group bacterium]